MTCRSNFMHLMHYSGLPDFYVIFFHGTGIFFIFIAMNFTRRTGVSEKNKNSAPPELRVNPATKKETVDFASTVWKGTDTRSVKG